MTGSSGPQIGAGSRAGVAPCERQVPSDPFPVKDARKPDKLTEAITGRRVLPQRRKGFGDEEDGRRAVLHTVPSCGQ